MELSLSRGVVVAAYEELIAEGYCVARTGAGTFVSGGVTAHDRPMAQEPVRLSAWASRLPASAAALSAVTQGQPRYDFGSGVAPDGFPGAAFQRAFRRAVDNLAGQRGAGDPAGSLRLRTALASRLARARGLRADPSRFVIVSGSQQGLDLASRLLLEPGDTVAVEEPGYPRARHVFDVLGCRLAPIPVDQHGVDSDALDAHDASMVYVTPSHQYPTGAVLSLERRLALLKYAGAHDAWILEDDYDSEFRYVGPPLPCLQGLDRDGRCVYLGSLSKLLHPALRIGYLVLPPALASIAVAAKGALDQATSPLIQDTLADMFESGESDRWLRHSSRLYRAKRARLIANIPILTAVGATVWPVTGGLHAFVQIPAVDSIRLFAALAERSITVVDGSEAWLSPSGGASLILWFSRIPLELIGGGLRALACAIRAAQ